MNNLTRLSFLNWNGSLQDPWGLFGRTASQKPFFRILNAFYVTLTATLCLTGCIGTGAFPKSNSSSSSNTNLQVKSSALATGVVQTTYTETLAATGGTPPYNWSLTNGDLPPGLRLDSVSGTLSGKPTMTGVFSFVTELQDSDHVSTVAKLSLSILAAPISTSQTTSGSGTTINPLSSSNPTNTPPSTASPQTSENGGPNNAFGLLSVSANSLSFGNVQIGESQMQTITLSNSGTGNITISSVMVSGAGTDATGVSVGQVLVPQQRATLNVTFAPPVTGSMTGSVDIATSNTTTSLTSIDISGAGVQAHSHSVDLTWNQSTSNDIAGYDVYRGSASNGPYTLLTDSPVITTSYTDNTVQPNQTYYYVVTVVASNNNQSTYSNAAPATIP
jgi:hypothetical protein